MNELIKVSNGEVAFTPGTLEVITQYEEAFKKIKSDYDQLKKDLLEEMDQKGVLKIESEHIRINYIEPTDREKFNTSEFKKEYPDIYDEFVKMVPVKSSIRITVK